MPDSVSVLFFTVLPPFALWRETATLYWIFLAVRKALDKTFARLQLPGFFAPLSRKAVILSGANDLRSCS